MTREPPGYGLEPGQHSRAAGIRLGGWCKTVGSTVRLPLTRHYVIGRRPVRGFHTTLLERFRVEGAIPPECSLAAV